MGFLGFVTSRKTLNRLIGFAGTQAVVALALDRLMPGQGPQAAGLLAGATAAVGQPFIQGGAEALREFAGQAISGAAGLWGNYAVSDHDKNQIAEALDRQRKFNHDLGLQVGRTIAKVIRDWAATNHAPVAADSLAKRAEASEGDSGLPVWFTAAEATGLDADEQRLVNIPLSHGGASFLDASQWETLLRAMIPPADAAGPAAAAYEQILAPRTHEGQTRPGPLPAHLTARFGQQFYIDIKNALEQHPKAWAAMQYRIQAQIVALATEGAAAAQRAAVSADAASDQAIRTRQEVLLLASRCAADLNRLWQQMDGQEQAILNKLNESSAAHAVLITEGFNGILSRLDELKARPPLQLDLDTNVRGGLPGLKYTVRSSTMVGREADDALLHEFLAAVPSPGLKWRQFCWWMITGDGGTGKSRTALELCLHARTVLGWDAGFLGRESDTDTVFSLNDWRHFKPQRPTLVVIDYAAERPQRVAQVIASLRASDNSGNHAHPVRVLLLERRAADERLRTEFAPDHAPECGAVQQSAYRGPDRASWHHALEVIDDHKLAELMEQTFAANGQTYPRAEVVDLLRRAEHGRRVLPEGNPLFAIVLAKVIVEFRALAPVHSMSAEELFRDILRRELVHWKAAGVDGKHLNLLVLATMLRRPAEVVAEMPEAVRRWLPDRYSVSANVCSVLSNYAGASQRPLLGVGHLEPDRFGELFVLDRMAGHADINAGVERQDNPIAAQDAAAALWAFVLSEPDSIEPALTFLDRACADYPHHPALPLAVRLPDALHGRAPDLGRKWWRISSIGRVRLLQRWRGYGAAENNLRQLLDVVRGEAIEGAASGTRREMSVCLDELGDLERAVRRPEAALPHYNESLDISRALAKELGTPEARRDLSVSLNNVGNVEFALGGPEAALPHYNESLTIRRAQVQENPTPKTWFEVAASHWRIASVLAAGNEPGASCTSFNECRKATLAAIAIAGPLPEYTRGLQACEAQMKTLGCTSPS